MNVDLVPTQDVDRIWPFISKSLADGLRKAPAGMSVGDLWTMCRSGDGFLILASEEQTILGITIWRFPSAEYFECVMIAGKKSKTWMKPICDFALLIAGQNGRAGIGGTGRLGWIDLMKRLYPRTKIVRQTYVVEIE